MYYLAMTFPRCHRILMKVTAQSICRGILIIRESLEYDIGKTDGAIRFFYVFLSIARLKISSLRSDYVFTASE